MLPMLTYADGGDLGDQGGSEAEELVQLRSKGLRGGGGGHEGGGVGRRVEHLRAQGSSWLQEADDEVRVPGGLRGGGGAGGQVRQVWLDAAEGRSV